MTDIKWGPNLATLGAPVMSGDSPALGAVHPDITAGNPRIVPTADGFTFAVDAHSGTANSHKSIRIALTAPAFTFNDDRLVEFTAHVHISKRPEGTLAFSMSAPPMPTLWARIWNDNYSELKPPAGGIVAQSFPVARLVYMGPPEGNPADFDATWILNKRDAEALLAGPNPSMLFDYVNGTALTSPVNLPEAQFTVSNVSVRVLEASGGAVAPSGDVLHFRDPADGKFKPLTEVRVRGAGGAAPDLSKAGIQWVPSPIPLKLDLSRPYVAPPAGSANGALPGGSVSVAGNIVTVTGTPVTVTKTSDGGALIPFVAPIPEHAFTPPDAGQVRFAVDVHIPTGMGAGWGLSVALEEGGKPTTAYRHFAAVGDHLGTDAVADYVADFRTLYLSGPEVARVLSGSNPGMRVTMAVLAVMSSGTTTQTLTVRVRNPRLEVLAVVAP